MPPKTVLEPHQQPSDHRPGQGRPEPSETLNEASSGLHGDDAGTVGNDVSPLLTLELADTENTAENSTASPDLDRPDLVNPLLGTTASTGIEKLRKSSSGRSPKRQCYGNLLRFSTDVQSKNRGKSAKYGSTN
jgi:hypothetical protein